MSDDHFRHTTLATGMGGIFLVILAWLAGKYLDTRRRRDLAAVAAPHSGFRFALAALYVCSAGLHVWLAAVTAGVS